MKRLTVLTFVLLCFCANAAYTEFYIQQTGNNLNSGSTTDDTAPLTFAGGTFVRSTGVYTLASGNTLGVSVGDWASVYTTGETCTACVGRVAATNATTITLNLATIAGSTANVSESANASTLKIGGAWKGPTTGQAYAAAGYPTNTFPFLLISGTMTNALICPPRINIHGGAYGSTPYSITNALTIANAGPMTIQGYTNSVGDRGKATIHAGTFGAALALVSVSGVNIELADLVGATNGTAGSADIFLGGGGGPKFIRCVAHDSRRHGFAPTGAGAVVTECEAYNCNKNGSADGSGINLQGAGVILNCISHDNLGNTSDGFISAQAPLINCISVNNTKWGFKLDGGNTAYNTIWGCVAMSNTVAAVVTTSYAQLDIRNSMFFANGAAVTNSSATLGKNGSIVNCILGSGTQANIHGPWTNFYGVDITGIITYTADTLPWSGLGNFNLVAGSSAKAAGSSLFTETGNGWSGTVSYPDIGPAQGASTNSATGNSGGAYTWAQ